MKQKQTFLGKLGLVLNTSSETFMLVALIALFAMPFVIAANLEPIVKDAEVSSNNIPVPQQHVANVNPNEVTPTDATANVDPATGAVFGTESNPNVLGVQTQEDDDAVAFQVTPDATTKKYFAKFEPAQDPSHYALHVTSTQVFTKVSMFTVKNGGAKEHAYKINVTNNSKIKGTDRVLTVGTTTYKIGTDELPDYVTVQPGEELNFSLTTGKTKGIDLMINVELVKNQ